MSSSARPNSTTSELSIFIGLLLSSLMRSGSGRPGLVTQDSRWRLLCGGCIDCGRVLDSRWHPTLRIHQADLILNEVFRWTQFNNFSFVELHWPLPPFFVYLPYR